jgi:radical SAM superfamily enzyme YgiQ (UPF0313 family)
LICPSWQRISYQTHYVLPPLGVLAVAAATPPEHEVVIADENIAPIDLSGPADIVGISMLLACQAPRALALADAFRARGVPVIMGGLSATCMADILKPHADALVLGEAEGVWAQALADAARGRLRPVYHRKSLTAAHDIPSARHELTDTSAYSYRGLRMPELVETSRGCSRRCPVCPVPRVMGQRHRYRDVDQVVAEMAAIGSERLYIVDCQLKFDESHERRLFRAMAGLGKTLATQELGLNPRLLRLAADAGCRLVFLPIQEDLARVPEVVKRLHDAGIAVEGSCCFGYDHHGPDIFERMTDFLSAVGMDYAEFTILTPFPGTPLRDRLKREGRILHEDWSRYNAGNVVFQPARMTAARLEAGYRGAWERFYGKETEPLRMARLLRRMGGGPGFEPVSVVDERKVIPFQKSGTAARWGGVARALRKKA